MKRVHPRFMKLDFSNEDDFVKTMFELPKNIEKGIEYWENTLNQEIGPVTSTEAPLIIVALRELADLYAENVPGAGKVADDLRGLISKTNYDVIKVPR